MFEHHFLFLNPHSLIARFPRTGSGDPSRPVVHGRVLQGRAPLWMPAGAFAKIYSEEVSRETRLTLRVSTTPKEMWGRDRRFPAVVEILASLPVPRWSFAGLQALFAVPARSRGAAGDGFSRRCRGYRQQRGRSGRGSGGKVDGHHLRVRRRRRVFAEVDEDEVCDALGPVPVWRPSSLYPSVTRCVHM